MTYNFSPLMHLVLGNLFVLASLILFGGDVVLLLFAYFIEIYVSLIFQTCIIFFGHKYVRGMDYRGLFMDLGFLIPVLFYIFAYGSEHFIYLINTNFEGPILSSWTFWVVLFSVFLSQIYIYAHTFVFTNDYRLPSPSFFSIDLFANSFAVITSTSAFFIFFSTLKNSFLLLILLFVVKTMAHAFMKIGILNAGLAKADHVYPLRRRLIARFFPSLR